MTSNYDAMATKQAPTTRVWHHTDSKASYQVSTSPSLLDHEFINTAFGTDAMHWARSVSSQELQTMLSNSLTLGLYIQLSDKKPPKSADEPDSPRTPSPTLEGKDEMLEQIGLARLVTDHVTFVYLTDMYIDPQFRGRGLGRWLVKCVGEILKDMPSLRTFLLLTRNKEAAKMYEKELGVWDVSSEGGGLVCLKK